MSNPTAFDHRVDETMRAVFDQMRAVHQDHACLTAACRTDFFRAIVDHKLNVCGTGRRSLDGVDKDLIEGAEAAALGQWIDFQPLEIQRFGHGTHDGDVLPRRAALRNVVLAAARYKLTATPGGTSP